MTEKAMIALYKWMELSRRAQLNTESQITKLTESKIYNSVELQELVIRLHEIVEQSDELREITDKDESLRQARFKKLIKLLQSIDHEELIEIRDFGNQTGDFRDLIDQIIEIKESGPSTDS